MVECHSAVLEEDTAAVIEKATHIAMTRDTRQKYVVVRCRCVMGNGWPAGYLPREQFEERMSNADDKGGFAPDGLRLQSGGSSSSRTPGAEAACVYTASGRDGLVVDLLLDFLKKNTKTSKTKERTWSKRCGRRLPQGPTTSTPPSPARQRKFVVSAQMERPTSSWLAAGRRRVLLKMSSSWAVAAPTLCTAL